MGIKTGIFHWIWQKLYSEKDGILNQAQADGRMHEKGTEWFMQFSFLCAAAAGLVYIGKAAPVITAVQTAWKQAL